MSDSSSSGPSAGVAGAVIGGAAVIIAAVITVLPNLTDATQPTPSSVAVLTSPTATFSPTATPSATTAPQNPSVGPVLTPIQPTLPPVLVSCVGDLETDLWGDLSTTSLNYTAQADMCVTELTLSMTTAGTGVAHLTVDGASVYSLDLNQFDTLGEEGAGSGERVIRLGRVIGVAQGHQLSLDLSGCVNCGGLIVAFQAHLQ